MADQDAPEFDDTPEGEDAAGVRAPRVVTSPGAVQARSTASME